MIRLDQFWRDTPRGPLLIFIGAAIVSFVKLFFGVSFHDEVLLLSMNYRFYLGDIPFRDETLVVQTAALTTQPLFYLFLKAAGSTEGVVLFGRLCYWLATAATATIAVRGIKQVSGKGQALVAGAICFVVAPYAIQALTYNSIPYLALPAGLFLLFLFSKDSPALHLAAGVLHAVMVLAYPPMAVCVAATAFAIGKSRKLIFYCLGGGGVVGTLFLFVNPWQFDLGPQAKLRMGEGVLFKLSQIGAWFGELRSTGSWIFLLSLTLLSFVFLFRKKGRIAIGLFVAAYFSWFVWPLSPTSSVLAVAWLGFLSPVLCLLSSAKTRTQFLKIIIPSVLGALVFTFTSDNYAGKAGYALLGPALIAAVVLLNVFEEKISGRSLGQTLLGLVLTAPLVVCLVSSFEEDRVWKLTERISNGPYRGLYTTARKAEFTQALQNSLKEHARGRRIFFYPQLPGGYLMTPSRPHTRSVWIHPCDVPGGCDASLIEFLNSTCASEPTLVVNFHSLYKCAPTARIYHASPFTEWLAKTGRPLVSQPTYDFVSVCENSLRIQ